VTSSNGKLKLGAAEWITLASLAMTPAGGFAWWGLNMQTRIAVTENTMSQMAVVLTKLETKTDILARIEVQQAGMIERQSALESRIERIEHDVQQLARNRSSGTN
jgi:hypothetical protein